LYENLEPVLDTCAREGFDGVLPRFQSHFRMTGRSIQVRDLDGSTRSGSVLGIDRDGALRLLRDGCDTEERIVAGDVTLAREQPA
jgi:biotin-(acetyl-CoA carboxylase) ligase